MEDNEADLSTRANVLAKVGFTEDAIPDVDVTSQDGSVKPTPEKRSRAKIEKDHVERPTKKVCGDCNCKKRKTKDTNCGPNGRSDGKESGTIRTEAVDEGELAQESSHRRYGIESLVHEM
ncbi:hypothetical protein KC367_g5623 [Hortaea werneckii]|nr:hypothetical protein KC357_g8406 [Hortaea werneckii]KAI7497755.1 hypothetical protein KC367_g5623 [Hortaea werneckii]